jgi:hypothetical protein
VIALVVVGVGVVLLVLVGAWLLSRVRRFAKARSALRAAVQERAATLRDLRGEVAARAGRARHPSA